MRITFDSSALVAVCVEAHPKHDSAFSWLRRAKNKEIEYVISAHSLAEVYSVLTGSPFNPPISPSTAKNLIERNIKSDAKIVTLSEKDYFHIIEKMNRLGLRGGIVYDAIIVECAQKSKSEAIITSNIKDFSRLLPDATIEIITL